MKFPELMNSNIDTLELDKVSNVVPKNIYKTNSEKLWIQNTRELIKLLKTQIDSFVVRLFLKEDLKCGCLNEGIEARVCTARWSHTHRLLDSLQQHSVEQTGRHWSVLRGDSPQYDDLDAEVEARNIP